MIKEWGFLNKPSPTTFKVELLIGYPFHFDPPPQFLDPLIEYFRSYMLDLRAVRSVALSTVTPIVHVSDPSLSYFRSYLGGNT